MTEQVSYSETSSEQEPPSLSAENEEEAQNFHIDRQVVLTDSKEQQFDSHFLQNFVPIRCLGKGGFGVVIESRNKVDQRNYAIKRIRLSNKPGAREKAEREVRALERLKHRAIVGYISTWTETPPRGWQEKTDVELKLDLSSFQSSGSNSTTSSTDFEKIKNQSGRNDASDSSGLTGSCSRLTDLRTNTWTETPPQGWQKKTDEALMLDRSSFQSSWSNSTSNSTDIEKIKNQLGRKEASDFCVFFENTNEKSRSTNEKPRKKKEIIDFTFLYIQMELCQKESLQTWLANNYSRDYIKCLGIFHQVLSAVEYLHDNNLIHRDLKPSNIFFSLDGVIKVGDFGLVTETDNEMIDDISKNSEINIVEYKTKKGTHTKGVGTRLYMAPEQLSGGDYGKKVDIFALGLILFELFLHFSTQMERFCEMEKARDSEFDKRFQNRNEVGLVELVKQMLSSQPSHRPTAQDGMLGITYFRKKRMLERIIGRLNKHAATLKENKDMMEHEKCIWRRLEECKESTLTKDIRRLQRWEVVCERGRELKRVNELAEAKWQRMLQHVLERDGERGNLRGERGNLREKRMWGTWKPESAMECNWERVWERAERSEPRKEIEKARRDFERARRDFEQARRDFKKTAYLG